MRDYDPYRNAPKKPSNPPMPKCKPPKDDWEIPSFMKTFRPKRDTVKFYASDGEVYEFEVDNDEL